MRSFIAGIYNACDYWCDRCAFTRRCRNFAMGEEEAKAERRGARSDEKNQALWDSVDAVLADARKRLDDWAAENFDDVLSDAAENFSAEDEERFQAEQDARERAVGRHFVVRASDDYCKVVSAWLKTVGPEVKEVADGWLAQARFAPEGESPRDAIDRLEDLFDIVSWYHTLLPPKARRMIAGLIELPKQTAWNDGGDVFGTGRLLLVSIDRSIGAWSELIRSLPKQEDAILGFLVRLDHLRRGVERAVPQARGFIRPGLDEPQT